MTKIETALAILQNKPVPLWSSGDLLTFDELKQLAPFPPTKIQPLFATSQAVGTLCFFGELECQGCRGMFKAQFTKTAMLSLFGTGKEHGSHRHLADWKCPTCASEERKQWKARSEWTEDNWREEREKRTANAIDGIGSPEKQFSMARREWWKYTQAILQSIDLDKFADHLKSLSYADFLATPYWKAVASYVKYKARFKCQLCASDEKLSAHHRDYSTHGYEAQNINDLICLCENCHQTFHDKLSA